MNNKIIIETEHDVINTKDALKYLKTKYKNSGIHFLGWNSGKKIIQIDGTNYYFSSSLRQILLKETKVKNIKILESKVNYLNQYKKVLDK